MAITFDPVKRARTLRERGLDFKDAEIVFAGETASQTSEQSDYGEVCVITPAFSVIAWSLSSGPDVAITVTSFQ